MYNFFLRPFAHLWFVPICATMLLHTLWYVMTMDFAPVNIHVKTIAEGFNVTWGQFEWTALDRLWCVAVLCWTWFQVRAFGPRWFKTIRRLNYNRVARIG